MTKSADNDPWHGSVTEQPLLYDKYHNDFADDLQFYIRECDGHAGILECGSGTGRLTFPLARAGFEVTALDSSKAMLERLTQRSQLEFPQLLPKIETVLGDMTAMELGRTFSCIIVPFMTFNYLPDTSAQINAFRSFVRHLRPKGILMIDYMSMHPNWINPSQKPVTISENALENGKRLKITRSITSDLPSQIVEQERVFETIDEQGKSIRSDVVTWRNRIVSVGEIELLHLLHGFKLRGLYGGYKSEAYTSKHLNCISVAHIPE